MQPKDTEKHIVVIEIENDINDLGGKVSSNLPKDYRDAILVQSQMDNQVQGQTFTNIVPSMVEIEGRKVLYHYMIYDLCQLKATSVVNIKVTVNSGSYNGKIIARIDKVEKFKIICPAANSDVFMPRQDHGSCQSYDKNLYVFGGQYKVGDRVQYLNDVMRFDTVKKQWTNISPTKGDAPSPRSGHLQLCFYNYIFIFGGIG